MDPKYAGDEEDEFGFSRNYFLSKEIGSASAKKSAARKVSDINLVGEQDLRDAVSSLPLKHEREIEALLKKYKDNYSKWLFALRCGINLLMYGFGSKKALIEDFASTALTDFGVIVINGYLSSVNLKQAVITIAEVLHEQMKGNQKRSAKSKSKMDQPYSSQSMEDILSFLNGQQSNNNSLVCVVIHNIDGPALRDSESQQYLARLASCAHVAMVASIDHVNAPLLWDKKMVHTQFNWSWYHVPTFAPYKAEGIFYPLVLASGTAAQTTKTALVVLQSLTPNAQSVFKVLAEYQLADPEDEGMSVDALYSACREKFLVSSLLTLKSHLQEFKDHELVKTRRHSDGHDCLYIPLSSESIQNLLPELP